MKIIDDIFGAISFLTILPFKSTFNPARVVMYFPIVGLLIGLMLFIVDTVFAPFWPEEVTAVLDVVFLVLITGGLHLDGLSDALDGFYGGKNRESVLLIMKDSRVGAMGVLAVVCALGIKWAGIFSLHHQRWLWLIIVPALARSGVLIGMKILPYGRPEGGTGQIFADSPFQIKHLWAILLVLLLALSGGMRGIISAMVCGVITMCLIGYYRFRLQCITGDMCGAMIEVTEALLFLIAAADF